MVVFRGTRPRAPRKEVAQELHAAVKMSSGAADTGESKNKSLLRNERVPGRESAEQVGWDLGHGLGRFKVVGGFPAGKMAGTGTRQQRQWEPAPRCTCGLTHPQRARGEAGAVPERKGRQACPVTAWSPGAGLPARGLGFPYPSTTCLPRLEPAARAGWPLWHGGRHRGAAVMAAEGGGRRLGGEGALDGTSPARPCPCPQLLSEGGVGTGLPALVLGDTGSGCPAGTEADLGDGHHRARGPRAEQTRGGKGAWRWA